MKVGLSISTSPDLRRLGLSELHLEDAMLEVARYLLAQGHHLAYGGDLRPGGFARALRELAAAYAPGARQRPITSFLASWVWKQTPEAERAWLSAVCRLVQVEPHPEALKPPEPSEDCERALSFHQMRREMTAHIEARLLLGGKLTDWRGRMPGLIEEALLAVEAGRPLYLLGAFGGCTAAIIQAVQGQAPEAFSVDFHTRHQPELTALHRELDGRLGSEMGSHCLERALQVFQALGVEGLARLNGLTREENETLFTTPHVPVAIALVLRGLKLVGGEKAVEP